ncbi:MAG TPA: aminoglycoside phosphotransferase family protein [Rhizomicrobium sp.]|jgi:aminoglycoside phosphotransferase (APT) family kinase protein
MSDDTQLAGSLVSMGLIEPGEDFTATPLLGGVSCDVWRVDLKGGPICVKRALPKLRVAADWRAPAERASTEADWFRLVTAMDPRRAPEVLGEDRPHHIFAMEYLPPENYRLWKNDLAEGRADPVFAADVGEALARIHAETAGRDDIAHDFAHNAQFHALRLEPYLLYTAKKHPDLAPRIRSLSDGVFKARIALMQGDISPKNILAGPEGPVFLDAETACYGDPAFDLAFCLNHLLLKCVWQQPFAGPYLSSFAALADAYLAGVTWEEPDDIEARTASLLPALLLARIDGKSPVEYLTADKEKDFVRSAAKSLFADRIMRLDEIRETWRDAF